MIPLFLWQWKRKRCWVTASARSIPPGKIRFWKIGNACIDDLCVLEDCRDKGIGTKLYNEVLRYAKMRKCDAITLNVWEGNDAARAFYDKMGFAPQKTVMEKVL